MNLTQTQRDKLDFDPAEQETKYLSVFIRFSDQILRRAPDYDAFCEKYESVPRSKLRIQILNRLKKKADTSWQLFFWTSCSRYCCPDVGSQSRSSSVAGEGVRRAAA